MPRHINLRLTHLDLVGERFMLRFSGPDWPEPLEAFKRVVAADLRSWDEETKLWTLPASPETDALLDALFPEVFRQKITAIKSQLPLF